MNPLISVITPCYNDGHLLIDAINSLDLNEFPGVFEHIIVDDGSKDKNTLQVLEDIKRNGRNVIHQTNAGLGAARNKGISIAKGKYILPLDADNKINPAIFLSAAKMMDTDKEVDVVYTDAELFGIKTGKWETVGPFDPIKLIYWNYIDACALIRKDKLVELGCYDTSMPIMGFEDWELWLRMYFSQAGFLYLQQAGFHYRVREDSMIKQTTNADLQTTRHYLHHKYGEQIAGHYDALYEQFTKQKKYLSRLRNYNKKNKMKSIAKILMGEAFLDEEKFLAFENLKMKS